jgi:hypothetical protein
MRSVSFTGLVAVALIATGMVAFAQIRVRTETVRPDQAPGIIQKDLDSPIVIAAVKARKAEAAPAVSEVPPEIVTDLSLLPEPVARMRARILAAARSGRLDQVAAVMNAATIKPVFSFKDERDPILYWRSSFPDSGGVEVLSTLISILETGFVHVDEGTPQEIYLWPYFARMPLKGLSPEQKVELFRLVTGSDYRGMIDFGAYNFYRVGIGSDGTWHFFVTGG